MKITNLIIILLFLPFFSIGKVNFFQGSLNEAQRTAAMEGKLYFIDFYANYCLPCMLMDQTTFMDEELANYIKGNYVPLKLNIDDFDAYEVRNKHEVKVLPTIMIFSSDGRLLGSYEGSLTASSLHALLEKYNLPENRRKTTPPFSEQPYVDMAVEEQPTRISRTAPNRPNKEQNVPKPPQQPTIVQNQLVVPKITQSNTVNRPYNKTEARPEIPQTYSIENDIPVFGKETTTTSSFVVPKLTTNTTTTTNNTTTLSNTKPLNTNTKPSTTVAYKPQVRGLFEFRVNRHPSRGYMLQIGVFAEYGNVLMEVEKIQRLFPDRRVIVHIDEIKGKTVYRVGVGTFNTVSTARSFLPEVKAAGFDSFIKDLSGLK